MKDDRIFKRMKVLLAQGSEAEKMGNEALAKQCYEQIFLSNNQLSAKGKMQYKEFFYEPHRNIGRILFMENQFEDAKSHFEQAKSLSAFKLDNIHNQANQLRMLVHSTLIVGLNSSDERLIEEAHKLFNELELKSDKITSSSLRNEIASENEVLTAVRDQKVETIVEFSLPFPLITNQEGLVEYTYNDIQHVLEIKIIESPLTTMKGSGSGFFEIVEDKYGLANRTLIKLKIKKYINPNELVTLPSLSEENRIFQPLAHSINALNFFIERFRISSGHFWIETIFHKMITHYSCVVNAGNASLRVIPFNDCSLYRVGPHPVWLSERQNAQLHNLLGENSIPLWESLLLDAKDYLLRRRYREAIISVNGAFENFLHIHAKERLTRVLSEELVNQYLEGTPTYGDFFLKDYIREDQFNEAINKQLIKNFPPSTYHIVKKCHQQVPFPVGFNQLSKIISKIRSSRNEVSHGKDGVKDNELERKVLLAIDNFEKFIELCKR